MAFKVPTNPIYSMILWREAKQDPANLLHLKLVQIFIVNFFNPFVLPRSTQGAQRCTDIGQPFPEQVDLQNTGNQLQEEQWKEDEANSKL